MDLGRPLARPLPRLAAVHREKTCPRATGLIDVELRGREGGTLTLDPWPFGAERVEVRCEARRLRVPVQDEAALRRAFAQAELVTLEYSLSRA